MRRCRCRGPRTRNSHSEIESISHSTRTPRSRARQPHTRFAQRRHATRGHTPHILYVHAGRAAPRASDLSRSRLLNTHPKLPRLHRLDLHEQTFVDHAQERTRTADTAPSHDTCELLRIRRGSIQNVSCMFLEAAALGGGGDLTYAPTALLSARHHRQKREGAAPRQESLA